jgi:hypothetical protein
VDLTPSAKGWVAIENLLNEQYEQAAGFPAPGARPRLGLTLVF